LCYNINVNREINGQIITPSEPYRFARHIVEGKFPLKAGICIVISIYDFGRGGACAIIIEHFFDFAEHTYVHIHRSVSIDEAYEDLIFFIVRECCECCHDGGMAGSG